MNKRELLTEMGHEDAVVFDSPEFDDAIIGTTHDGRVVYDFDKMVKGFVEANGGTEEEAIEFIEYNTIRSLPYYPNSPVIMYPLEEM